jgi:ring-1,2-phenylacetyl-CoA epoxidase subunit PaaD
MQPSIAQVWEWLGEVPDPEIPVISVVDLGVVRDVAWDGNRLEVTVTPTYSGCPATRVIAMDIATALRDRGVTNPLVKSRIAPPWTTDWLSEAGRAKLEAFGIAAPQPTGRPARCPRCASTDLELVSAFGSTPCKAQWRCRACLEPFDYFKCL